jgi:hypothetical protein
VVRLQPRQHSQRRRGSLWPGWLLIALAVLVLGALAYFHFTVPGKPELDAASLCPKSGPQGITIVLIDTSDDLPTAAQREALTILKDQITGLQEYYKLDIRVLDILNARSRSLFSKCNPGDGTGLSEWTSNPRLARMRWIEAFHQPAEDAVNASLASAKAQRSPIMGAIQDIALEQFSSAAVETIPKLLIIISDMLEYTRDYSQYQPDLSYEHFKRSPAYLKYRTDLHGAHVKIEYVRRQNLPAGFDTRRHMEFWREWIIDNHGVFDIAHSLQGVG